MDEIYTSTRMHPINWGEYLLLLADEELARIGERPKEEIPEEDRIHVSWEGKDLYFSREEFGEYARRGKFLKSNREEINRIREGKGLSPVGGPTSDPLKWNQ